MEDEEKQVPDGGSDKSPANAGATDGATEGATEPGAGVAQPDYSMLMQMMQEMQDEELMHVGDEFVPIERLDLSI